MQLGTTQEKLKAVGVETMAVVNTPLERARLYFKYRPARVLLAADPEAKTHRSFRVPAGTLVENESEASWSQGTVTMGQMQAARINPTGELPEPQNPFVAMETLNKKDGFEVTEVDHADRGRARHAAGRALPHRPGRDHPLAADRGVWSGSRTSPSSRATRRSWPRPAAL